MSAYKIFESGLTRSREIIKEDENTSEVDFDKLDQFDLDIEEAYELCRENIKDGESEEHELELFHSEVENLLSELK